MRIIFCRGTGIIPAIIRMATFSRWAHVAIEVDGMIYDSSMEDGVRCWAPSDFYSKYPITYTAPFHGNSIKVVNFLLEQLGKRYDWGAVIGMPFRSSWQHPDKWFCSELAAAAVEASGFRQYRPDAHRITPRDMWVSL